jgi:hypothetical protein
VDLAEAAENPSVAAAAVTLAVDLAEAAAIADEVLPTSLGDRD